MLCLEVEFCYLCSPAELPAWAESLTLKPDGKANFVTVSTKPNTSRSIQTILKPDQFSPANVLGQSYVLIVYALYCLGRGKYSDTFLCQHKGSGLRVLI